MTKKTRVAAGIVGGCAIVAAAVLSASSAWQEGGAPDSVHVAGCPIPAVRVCQLPGPGGPSA